MVAAMVVGFDIDIAKLLISVIHERSFKASTTYPFACMIFQLCRIAGMTIWHIDVLRTPTESVDISLIWDKDNEASPRREPRIEVQPLGENLLDSVEQNPRGLSGNTSA